MVATLLALSAAAGLSGWLYITDAFWGEAWLENLHWALAFTLLVLTPLHVAGVLLASLRHGENLVGAMIHGCKRPPQNKDVT